MTLPVNPYIAGNPVGDTEAFVGRADVLRAVLRVLRHKQQNAIVLYGQRRIGKTSVLQYLETQLPQEGNFRPVRFDLQDKATWPLARVLENLARVIAHKISVPEPDLGDNPETAFRDTWLPAVFDDLPPEDSLVLLFDEFDVLADPDAEQAAATFFPYLRELLSQSPAQMQFVFVMGRNIADLSNIALSLFKGTTSNRVSLLTKKDNETLVRLSEVNQTLNWSTAAVGHIWELTHGHPFLTQQLCSHVWEAAYDDDPEDIPTATPDIIDTIIPEALDASRNTLEWLWDGLPPAERVVISALAEAGTGPITQEQLEELLRESGVRVVIRELQNAPQLLQDWDLIEPADGGYCFRVELLRRWLTEYKPLNRVQDELDRIGPAADSLYEAAYNLYLSGQLEQATGLLRQAIGLNPNHLRANELLAEILISREAYAEAQTILENLYEYHPAAARPRLIQTYLAQAQIDEDEDAQIRFYEQILSLYPEHPEASNRIREIWEQRGDAALKDNDLNAALKFYQAAGMGERATEVENELRRQELQAGLQNIEELESGQEYQKAFELGQQLRKTYPKERNWKPDLDRLEQKTQLDILYQRGLGALQSGDTETAQNVLGQIVALEPTYEQAALHLYQAVTGEDIGALHDQISQETDKRREFQVKVQTLQTELQRERTNSTRQTVSRRALMTWGVVSSLFAVIFIISWLNSTFGGNNAVAQATITSTQKTVASVTPIATEKPVFLACQVTDVGGIDDKSYNATAWEGMEDTVADFGIEAKYLESQQQSDYEVNINAFVEEGCDLIISIGFLLGDATAAYATANPDQMFAIVDVNWLEYPNLYGSGFAINEATFLAGYLAAGMTQTGVVATYGGIQIPPVEVFMDGFVLGVEAYNAAHGTDIYALGWDYTERNGLFVGNFESTDDGRTMGESLMDEGADIIMPIAGPVGAGTLAVMEERGGGMIIGSDTDWSVQFANQSEYVLASALKNMDLYVYETIQAAMDGTFAGGNYLGTLENGGVGLGYGGVEVPDDLKAEIETLVPKIVSGEIATLPSE